MSKLTYNGASSSTRAGIYIWEIAPSMSIHTVASLLSFCEHSKQQISSILCIICSNSALFATSFQTKFSKFSDNRPLEVSTSISWETLLYASALRAEVSDKSELMLFKNHAGDVMTTFLSMWERSKCKMIWQPERKPSSWSKSSSSSTLHTLWAKVLSCSRVMKYRPKLSSWLILGMMCNHFKGTCCLHSLRVRSIK